MTEQEALESTYWDSCCIYRRVKVKNPDTKQMEQTEACIAENSLCALSRNNSGDIQFDDQHGRYQSAYILFCSPETPIQAGDRVEVTTAQQQQFTLWAGKPFLYASHAEVPLMEEERA